MSHTDEVVQEFLERAQADVQGAGLAPLEHYQSRFPEDRELIAHEYAKFTYAGLATVAGDESTVGVERGHEFSCERIGNWEIQREIGRGAQGVVYVAEDTRLPRKAAVKVLRTGCLVSDIGLRRFRREAEVLSRVDDPGICSIYEVGAHEGAPFIAMRFIEGESLAEAMERSEDEASGTAPRRDADDDTRRLLRAVEDAARSLHHAHEAGIVHRDVKPANIMLPSSGVPVILDFGIASDSLSETLTQAGDLIGTPAFMAPEQIDERFGPIDRRCDVFALGVIIYRILTGLMPFQAPTRAALFKATTEREPIPPRRLAFGISRDLEVIVATAMEKNLDRRYQTALDLANDLERQREMRPISARPLSPVARIARWARRRPALAALVLFLMVALPVIASLGTYYYTTLDDLRELEQLHEAQEIAAILDRAFSRLAGEGDATKSVTELEAILERDPDNLEALTGLVIAHNDAKDQDAARAAADVHRAALTSPHAAAVMDRFLTEPSAHFLSRLPEESELDAEGLFVLATILLNTPHSPMTIVSRRRLQQAARILARLAFRSDQALRIHYSQLAHALMHLNTDDPLRATLGIPVAEGILAQWPDGVAALVYGAQMVRPFDAELSGRMVDSAADCGVPNERLATLLSGKGEHDRAVAMAREVVVARGHDCFSLESLGEILIAAGRPEDALEEFARAHRDGHEHSHVFASMASAAEHLEHFDEALGYLSRALEISPNATSYRSRRGAILSKIGRSDEAFKVYAALIRLQPHKSAHYYGAAHDLAKLKRWDDVVRITDNGIRLCTANSPSERRNLGWLHYWRAFALETLDLRPSDLIDSLKSATTLLEKSSILTTVGGSLRRAGQRPLALKAYDKAIAANPPNAVARRERGIVLSLLSRPVEASVDLEFAIANGAASASAAYYLGSSLGDLRDYWAASAAYDRCLTFDPNPWNAEALCNRASSWGNVGRHAESLVGYREGHDAGVARGNTWRYPSARWVTRSEQRVRDAESYARELNELLRRPDFPSRDVELRRLHEGMATLGRGHDLGRMWQAVLDGDEKSARRWGFLSGSGLLHAARSTPPTEGDARTRWRLMALTSLQARLDTIVAGEPGARPSLAKWELQVRRLLIGQVIPKREQESWDALLEAAEAALDDQ